MKFLNLIVDHARATLSIMLLVLFAGTMGRIALPVEVNPNVTLPLVMIMVRHDGISPEDGTRLLIRPIEKELKTLDGLEEINAVAREGAIYIMAEFDISEDIDKVVSEVRESVDRAKAEFPQETKEPIVNELSPSPEPTVVITFSGEQVSERELYKTAKFFQRKLEMLPDVLKADISGHRDEVVEAVLDPYRLEQYNITADEMLRSVRANNLLIPAGEIDAAQGRFGIKVPALIETTEDIRRLPVRFTADGVITLGDIADIRRTFKDASGFSTINGQKTIAIDVRKRLNANAIETVAAVRAAVASYQGQFSQNINIDFIFDSSEYAQSMVSELQGNILTAMSLVLVLVVATLGVRSGLLVGFGIPFCLLGSMIVIYLLGFSFNFMVMFGLLLSLGMLIDGAIVVVEFANTRASEGLSNREAYLVAVKRMAIPVIASTGTTLAAFLPLLFWPGVAGEFMSYLPITVFAVLGWSLTYALIFAPTLGIVISRRRGKSRKLPEDHGSEESAKNLFQPLLNFYLRMLTPIIARPAISSVVAIFFLMSIFWGYGKFGAGQAFFADIENRYGVVNVRAQGNLSVEEQRKITAEVERRISTIPGIQQLYGFSEGNSITLERDSSRDKISSFLVELYPRGQRERGSLEIFAEIRQSTANMPGIYVTGKEVEAGPPVGKDIQIQISSTDRELMYKTTAEIRDWIKLNIEGLRDIEDTLPLAGIQWEMVVDRPHAAMLGVNVSNIGQMVQMVTNGVRLGEFRPDDADDEVEIRLRYPEQNRQLAALDELRVNTPAGPVPISSFSQRVAKPRVDAIQRIDMLETVYILANTEDGYLSDNQTKAIEEWLATQDVDESIKVIFRGANEEQADSAAFLSVAFSLAMSLMLIMLVMQFNSFYQAFLILFSVVMSTAGVMLGLLISQAIFSTILTGVGIVALAGIVVNNNIVLIDSYNFLRRSNTSLSAAEAVYSAAKSRFRPVMLTTVTTVVGLLPLANGYSVDIINRTFEAGGMVSTWWQPLASAIVNGLLLSTVLTLLLTPAMLLLPEIISKRFGVRVGSNEFDSDAA
ncbi:efflux RND transporter permease subunit [Porticoccaceae bacterium]|nr:efflux RND transporter permease subunit [Porticoccaceae bacterium]MDC0010393.1 efflux RND transporter permease subunit [Porticoccaceae bacterium]MDC1453288.1 efflux RND transporter permease subunit [Porticoccaceae bacterium]